MGNTFIKIFFLFSVMYFAGVVSAQTYVYSFLDLPVSSRMAALGGKNVSLGGNDLQFAMMNPASLSAGSDQMIGFSMANYLADIKFGTAVYGWNKGRNNFAAGVQYVDYGTFKNTDEFNEILGEFSAKDIALYFIYSRELMSGLTAGATFKPIFSFYERYSSFGGAIDLGLNYQQSDQLFSAGLALRNMGTQIKGYTAGLDGQHYEPLPFDLQLGISRKLEHAPFRFSLTLHNLHRWDLYYTDNPKALPDYDRVDLVSSTSWIDMAFRHAIFGVEILPGNNFYIAASYNHRRHQELKMDGFKSMAGFSFGVGLKISKFQVGFGMSQFQVGNNTYQFSISTSLSEFRIM